jgi:hypothetical protein
MPELGTGPQTVGVGVGVGVKVPHIPGIRDCLPLIRA